MVWTALTRQLRVMMAAVEHVIRGAPPTEEMTTVGVDLARSVFRVHALDATGRVGLEAGSSAHHWGRVLRQLGHDVRLLPPVYVKPCVRRQKNDVADATATCEAVTRPSMRFVSIKSEEQQAALMLHRARSLLPSQRTALICVIRGHMAELDLTAPRAVRNLRPLLSVPGR
ncbi:hypothetical protein C5708_03155 [Caulobacter sp. CCUG 60055]|uniref:IS110 family transposase n=1 Tax=Caulobacter sp. CCUG 60055 TaxID=2100090 RepID=UPI001FA7A552|nr:transposase [Caulobacter sp. CCUG 60055]MCI3179243.1 hypothetical protein [Caulobacter sp. CCUG 60055]